MSEPPYATDRETLERDCEVETFIASGPGGQHRNKTESGVRLRHRPSGEVVSATERRSQHQNLEVAYERMQRRLSDLNEVPKERHPTRPSRGARLARLREKAHQGNLKRKRKAPGDAD